MKIACFSFLALLPLSLVAEEAAVSHELLSISTGQHAEHLLSGIENLRLSQQQLRQERRSVAPMFGKKSSGDKGGSRIFLQRDGETEAAVWSVAETDEKGISLESENAGLTARITLEENATAARVSLQWEEGRPPSPLHWEWMLEIGGDFFAVPTEGIADHQIYLAQEGEGPQRVRIAPVPRESRKNFALIEPWWAVADRNRLMIVVCRLEGTAGALEVQQFSGNQGSADAFEQTVTLHPREGARQIDAKISLYSGLPFLNALGESTAYYLNRSGETAIIHAATERRIERGELVLIQAGKKIAEWPLTQWTPQEPLALPLGSGLLSEELGDCWLELREENRPAERIAIYQEEIL